jgi:hypothetical protein
LSLREARSDDLSAEGFAKAEAIQLEFQMDCRSRLNLLRNDKQRKQYFFDLGSATLATSEDRPDDRCASGMD